MNLSMSLYFYFFGQDLEEPEDSNIEKYFRIRTQSMSLSNGSDSF